MQAKKVLLIQDNKDEVFLFKLALKRIQASCDLSYPDSSAEGLNFLFDTSKHSLKPTEYPDIIFLDVNLKLIDFIELLKRIRTHANTKLIPVILFVNSKIQIDQIQKLNLNINGYIIPDADFNKFCHTLSFWIDINQSPNQPLN